MDSAALFLGTLLTFAFFSHLVFSSSPSRAAARPAAQTQAENAGSSHRGQVRFLQQDFCQEGPEAR